MTPDLSIIIVSYRTRALLETCLRSLEPPAGMSLQTIVVDNASGDGTAEMVREQFPDVLLIANSTNAGYSAANNQGIRAAAGRILLFLNPDTECNPDALAAMCSFIESHPRTGSVGVQLLNTDGSLQTSHFDIPVPLSRYFGGSRIFAALARRALRLPPLATDPATPGATRVDAIKGACLMISRAALDDVGTFDEGSFLYADDIDWGIRARRRGWSAYLITDRTILHHGYASTDQEIFLTITSSRKSALLLYKKHYPGWIRALWTFFIHSEIIYKYALNTLRARRGGEKNEQRRLAYSALFREVVLKRK